MLCLKQYTLILKPTTVLSSWARALRMELAGDIRVCLNPSIFLHTFQDCEIRLIFLLGYQEVNQLLILMNHNSLQVSLKFLNSKTSLKRCGAPVGNGLQIWSNLCILSATRTTTETVYLLLIPRKWTSMRGHLIFLPRVFDRTSKHIFDGFLLIVVIQHRRQNVPCERIHFFMRGGYRWFLCVNATQFSSFVNIFCDRLRWNEH